MNRFLRQTMAWLLSTALLCSTALASDALGEELSKTTVPLAAGTTLTTQQLWSSSKTDYRTEHYITYTPGSGLSPAVSYGSSILSMSSVSTMAKRMEQAGKRVLSGINGDYFVMASGDPLGMVVTDGILRSSPAYLSAIGFLPDGTALVGKPDVSVNATFSGNTLKVAEVNKIRTTSGYYLLTEDFGATTKNTQAGIDVILAPQTEQLGETVTAGTGTLLRSNQLKLGGRVSCVVEQVVEDAKNLPIPPGKFVLTVNKKSDAWLVSELLALTPGATVDIDVSSSDPRWNSVSCAVGAMHRIVTAGAVEAGLEAGAAPRTAVGVKADGTAIFYTIDGRQSGLSIGASLTQVATRLVELGCVDAVALDGGGSTTLGVTMPDNTGFTVSNSPSGGTQRAVTNALFLVSNLAPSGTAGSLYVKPSQSIVLTGGTLACTASFLDSNWYPMTSGDPITWTAKYGSISPSGQYIAPATACVDEITGTSGAVSGTATVKVYDTPDAVRILNEETGANLAQLQLTVGQTLNLMATATYRGLSLAAMDTSFQWAVPPAVGTITPDGTLTAGAAAASGYLTITVGQHSASIPVSVAAGTQIPPNPTPELPPTPTPTPNPDAAFLPLLDFEESKLSAFRDTEGVTARLDSAQVRYGKQSLRLTFDSQLQEVTVPMDLVLPANAPQLSVWVYGDQSGHLLSLQGKDTSGTAQRIPLTTLHFQGWEQIWMTLPAGVTQLSGLTRSGSGAMKGEIWLDQMTVSNQTAADHTPPAVSLSVSGAQLTASISDHDKTPLTESQLSLTLDGTVLPFTWDGATLLATLPSYSNVAHQVTVKAVDVSGNIGAASTVLNPTGVGRAPFPDLRGHWAEPYVASLEEAGIVNGMGSGNKQFFSPAASITRGDFALMTARSMGLELEQFAQIALPFADTDQIPAWSLNAVKAMYSLGMMQGSQVGETLYANATHSISRAEAMTILGRMQEKGYPAAELSVYEDAAQVPTWAASYVKTLVGQNIVQGDQGRLRPNDSVSRAEMAKLLFSLR